MNIIPIFNSHAHAILALIAGIIILIRPQVLALVVAIYLIVEGVLGLTGYK